MRSILTAGLLALSAAGSAQPPSAPVANAPAPHDLELVLVPVGAPHVGKPLRVRVGIRNTGTQPISLVTSIVRSGSIYYWSHRVPTGENWGITDVGPGCPTEPAAWHVILPGKTFFVATQITPAHSGRADLELGLTVRRLGPAGACGDEERLNGRRSLHIAAR